MRNAGLEEAQAGIKIAGRNINNLRYADDTTLMAEKLSAFETRVWRAFTFLDLRKLKTYHNPRKFYSRKTDECQNSELGGV